MIKPVNAKVVIPRRAPCPCGSRKKYKDCHGCVGKQHEQLGNMAIRALHQLNDTLANRREAFGDGHRLVSTSFDGERVVAVGGKIYKGPWKTPLNFYVDYVVDRFGEEWFHSETQSTHPIVEWLLGVVRWAGSPVHTQSADGLVEAYADGNTRAFMGFAHDLWTLDNLALLQVRMIKRLKIADQFHGARYELFVAAALERAGFELQIIDEGSGSGTFQEFNAKHKATGRWISVEAKARGHRGMLGKAGERLDASTIQLSIANLLRKALLKDADHERVVFIDVNMPPTKGEPYRPASWINQAALQVERVEEIRDPNRPPLPRAFVFLTNHPYHYSPEGQAPPGFCYLTYVNHEEAFPRSSEDRSDHLLETLFPEVKALRDSVFAHQSVPQRFHGG